MASYSPAIIRHEAAEPLFLCWFARSETSNLEVLSAVAHADHSYCCHSQGLRFLVREPGSLYHQQRVCLQVLTLLLNLDLILLALTSDHHFVLY